MRNSRRDARQFQNTYPQMFPGRKVKTVTFIVTHQCNLRCTYCYETHKSDRKMDLETAKRCVDLLFAEDARNSELVNDRDAHGLIIEFIGGEPFLEIDLIDQTMTYFLSRAMELDHRWQTQYMVNISTNGTLGDDPRVQQFMKKYAGRLVLQEYDPEKKAMTGPVRDIYRGEKIFLEGPHIYKRQGWYYLFAADTGTGEGHGQSVLRSRDIWGPYEMLKENHGEQREENEAFSILTSRHHEDILLQKSGHGDLVETPGGEWYMVHLCGRAFVDRNPADAGRFPNSRRYMMGRETAIQKILWREDGWPVLEAGGTTPQNEVPVPKEVSEEVLCRKAAAFPLVRDDFEEKVLSLDYQSLRIPMDEHYLSLSARPGWLRMYGRSGLSSRFSQTLIARRMREYCMEASACVEFEPEVFKQMAGLIFLYDCDNYLYLHISRDEDVGKCITLLKAENKKYEYLTDYIPVREKEALYLKMETRNAITRFYYGYSEKDWQEIGPLINASFLSDEACGEGWFTGAMIGICCQDMTGFGRYADFDWFEVKCEPEELNR